MWLIPINAASLNVIVTRWGSVSKKVRNTYYKQGSEIIHSRQKDQGRREDFPSYTLPVLTFLACLCVCCWVPLRAVSMEIVLSSCCNTNISRWEIPHFSWVTSTAGVYHLHGDSCQWEILMDDITVKSTFFWDFLS